MKPKSIHRNDAILLLEDKQPHNLKVWKLSTGDIIEYKEATCIGGFKHKGTHRIMVPHSGSSESFGILLCLKLMG